MTVGETPKQAGLWRSSASVVGDRVEPDSIWGLLHREGHRIFPDELFADLYSSRGRRSVPPQVVATVMVLQRLFGMSDREAVEAFEFDVRWKYAAGGLDVDFPGFSHMVLVGMRARLARSDAPRRVFDAVLDTARGAGLVGRRRVLDSTPLYDSVATMDTVTLVRSAIRGLLRAADGDLEVELRAAMGSGDGYASNAKPQIDWDDEEARDDLIDTSARDGFACLEVVAGRVLGPEVANAAELLATVLGQDLEIGEDGRFRIVWGVAADRTISTVDADARHGHKTQARGFDGYKGHVAVDPDSEIITETTVTAGNVGDASVAEDLIADLTDNNNNDDDGDDGDDDNDGDDGDGDGDDGDGDGDDGDGDGDGVAKAKVYGDSAYGTGPFQQHLNDNDVESGCRTQPPAPRPGGLFTKDDFAINLDDDTVTCPAGETTDIDRDAHGDGTARFADACADCPMRGSCTTSASGRTVKISRYEPALAEAREQQTHPHWKADYRAVRPKVERKLGHLTRRYHGGRRARVRGRPKVDADFNLLAAAHNLNRFAALNVRYDNSTGWTTAT